MLSKKEVTTVAVGQSFKEVCMKVQLWNQATVNTVTTELINMHKVMKKRDLDRKSVV